VEDYYRSIPDTFVEQMLLDGIRVMPSFYKEEEEIDDNYTRL
jgi:hypothetical protein